MHISNLPSSDLVPEVIFNKCNEQISIYCNGKMLSIIVDKTKFAKEICSTEHGLLWAAVNDMRFKK